MSEHRLATETAQLALRGEGPPPVIFDKRIGAALDLTTGVLVCSRCGSHALKLVNILGLPAPLHPEMVAASMVCDAGHEQAVTLEQRDGKVVLSTVTRG